MPFSLNKIKNYLTSVRHNKRFPPLKWAALTTGKQKLGKAESKRNLFFCHPHRASPIEEKGCLYSPHRCEGFTFVELMVVVVVLGVIAGMAFVNFSQVYNKLVIKQAAKNLASFLRFAQSRAMIHQREHQLLLDKATRRYELKELILIDNPDPQKKKQFKPVSLTAARSGQWPEGIDVRFDKTEIIFKEDGKIDPVNISFCQQEKCWLVTTQIQNTTVQILPTENDEDERQDEESSNIK